MFRDPNLGWFLQRPEFIQLRVFLREYDACVATESPVLEAFNLFDAEVSDIDYFYASRLAGEPADGGEDIHLHPALPRSARIGIQFSFSRSRSDHSPVTSSMIAMRPSS